MIPEPATVTSLDRDHIAGWWRDVSFVFWLGETRMSAVHALRDELQRKVDECPSGIAVFVVIAEHVSLPSGEARTEMARMLRQHASAIRGSCVAVEGSGFRAAAVRSVLAGLSFVVRPAYPHRVTDALVASADWLTDVCGTSLASGFSSAELRHAMTQVRNACYAATG